MTTETGTTVHDDHLVIPFIVTIHEPRDTRCLQRHGPYRNLILTGPA